MTPATLDPALRNGIGASQIAMLFGYGFGGPMELYMRLVHPEQAPAATADMKRGIRAEPLLAERYAEDHGLLHLHDDAVALTPDPTGLWSPPTQRHPAHDFLIASPDRVVLRDGKLVRILEIKTDRYGRGWEDPEIDPSGIPFGYLLQVQQQLACGVTVNGQWQQCDEADVVACIRHFADYRQYTVARSAKVEAAIVERAGCFWSDHVLPRRPPDFDGSEAGDALLKLLYPADTRPVLGKADATADEIAARLRVLEAQLKTCEAQVDTERQCLKALIGDSAGIESELFRATWKRNRDSQVVDWKAVADDLSKLFKADELAKLHAKHTTTKPGARPLRVTYKDSP